jgi:hypothetical protein
MHGVGRRWVALLLMLLAATGNNETPIGLISAYTVLSFSIGNISNIGSSGDKLMELKGFFCY